MRRKFPEIVIGQRFGSLTTIRKERHPTRRGTFWVCRCDCGTEKLIYQGHLNSGATKSCGCFPKNHNQTHGMAQSPEYKAWEAAKARCYRETNDRYQHYGARGIEMCAEWRNSFEAFYRDMGARPSPKHSLDRIDNNGDYQPGNCRWATSSQQNRNRSMNRTVSLDGKEVTVAEAAEITGIKHATILSRLNSGWSDEKALSCPVQ